MFKEGSRVFVPEGEEEKVSSNDERREDIDAIVDRIEGEVKSSQIVTKEQAEALCDKIVVLLQSTYPGKNVDRKSLPELVDQLISDYEESFHKHAYDDLTKLLRLEPFRERMEAILERSRPGELEHIKREKKQGALLFIDLNGMKQMNDSLGYLGTNDVIRQFAEKLTAVDTGTPVIRKYDLAMRFGGDEFALYLHGADPDQVGYAIVRRVIESLNAKPIKVTDASGQIQKVNVTFAVGVAPIIINHNSDIESEVEELITRASTQEKIAKSKSSHAETVLSYVSSNGENIIKNVEEIMYNGSKAQATGKN